MATTSNFGWETPDDTDYVYQGAQAMRLLGDGIDASLGDLKGGTSGQLLSKASNTDMDFTWATPTDPTPDGGYTLLASANPSGLSSVSLTGLTGYNSFLVQWYADTSASGAIVITFNSDTGNNYYINNGILSGSGTMLPYWGATGTSGIGFYGPSSGGPSSGYASVSGGTSATAGKTLYGNAIGRGFGNSIFQFTTGFWSGTAAIASIQVAISSGTFGSNTQIRLYGSAR